MIGAASPRSTLLATIAVLGVAALFGGRAPNAAQADPPRAARHAAALSTSLAAADAEIASLEALLRHALDEARRGAALVLEGDDPPEERFDAAAVALEMAGPSIGAAREALRQVERLGSSCIPAVAMPVLSIDAEEAARLGAELRASGTTAASVAALRHASDTVLNNLEEALAAAADGRPDDIIAAAASGRAGLVTVEAWRATLPTLAVWATGVRDLMDGLEGIATALRNGDAAALAAAHDAYAVAAEEASRADRGRAIALADAAASIGGGAPAELATLLAQAGALRAAVASVVLEPAAEGAP